MLKFTKVALIGSLCTVLSFQVLAQENVTNSGDIASNREPTVDCSKLVGACFFEHLKPQNSGNAAYYYCVPPVTATSFKMENHAVLITGFEANGTLAGPISDLNKYSFGAYEGNGWVPVVRIKDQSDNPIACYPGKGNRPVHPGRVGL